MAAIQAHTKPSTKSHLMNFLGKLLTDATRGAGGKHSKLVWTKEMGSAFLS